MKTTKIYAPLLLGIAALSLACSGRIEPQPEPNVTEEPDPDPDPVDPVDPIDPTDPDPVEPFFDGCRVSTLYRDPDTGFPVYRVVYTFDETDNMVGYEYDEGPDEVIEYRQGNEFDETGRATATLIDADGNEVIEEAYRYEYFDTGAFLAQVYEADADQNGTVDLVMRFEADAEGNFVLSTSDNDADGTIDERTDYRYDEAGNLLAVEVDLDNDGAVDERTALSYALDCEGEAPAEVFPVPVGCDLLTSIDLEDDGVVDDLERSTFDAEGRVLRSERDEGNDGDPILTFEANYDDEGRTLLERLDEDDNGVLELARTYSYEGELTTVHEERFNNETAALESTFDYTLDETGETVGGYTGTYDTDDDGVLDLAEVNEQDPRGVTTGVSYDLDLNGTADYTYTIDILDECVTEI